MRVGDGDALGCRFFRVVIWERGQSSIVTVEFGREPGWRPRYTESQVVVKRTDVDQRPPSFPEIRCVVNFRITNEWVAEVAVRASGP